ncbi:MAG: hypothetical protein QW197_02325 [Candidatus Aenigmatarchaeota archaeon]
MNKKLISAFVATIILVALTVGIGVMIYLYFAGYMTQTRSQIEEVPVKSLIECSKVNVDIAASGGSGYVNLTLVNLGIDLGRNFAARFEYDDGRVEIRNITLDYNFISGNVTTVKNIQVPPGTINRIVLYSTDPNYCPGMIVGSVNVKVTVQEVAVA